MNPDAPWNRRQPTPEAAEAARAIFTMINELAILHFKKHLLDVDILPVFDSIIAKHAHPPKPEPTEAPKPPAEWMAEAAIEIIKTLGTTHKDAQNPRQALDDIFSIIAKHAPKVPEGWQMVPVEPTPEMLEAAFEAPLRGHPETASQSYPDIYAAMLAAAPKGDQ